MAPYTIVHGCHGFLGQGTFGVVEKVIDDSTGKVFACKTIRFPDSDKHREPAEREYSILSSLDHPNVVQYVDIVWSSTSAKIYMSFCAGGSLADFIASKRTSTTQSQVSADYIFSVFHQLGAALLYCHNGLIVGDGGSITGNSLNWNPVLHRDIKPGNVMLSTRRETDEVVVKLGDFGLSTFLEDERAPSTYAGTKEYLAPVSLTGYIWLEKLGRLPVVDVSKQEINRYRQGKNHWTKTCDIFSLGCTIYELAKLVPPFLGHMDDDDSIEPLPDTLPSKLTSRIIACMSYHPERRPDAFDILRTIKWHRAGLDASQKPSSSDTACRLASPSILPEAFRRPRSVPNNSPDSAILMPSSDTAAASYTSSELMNRRYIRTGIPKEQSVFRAPTNRTHNVVHWPHEPVKGLMRLRVLTENGETYYVDLKETDLVSHIKGELCKKHGIQADGCRLTLRGTPLDEHKSISSYKIDNNNSILHLSLKVNKDTSNELFQIWIRIFTDMKMPTKISSRITFDEKTVSIKISSNITILEMKTKIFEEMGIPQWQQCLMLGGVELKDEKLASDCYIRPRSILYLVQRLREK